ncbi:MAG: hypothetical protein ACRCX2_24900 [Paraclostridium sp.]
MKKKIGAFKGVEASKFNIPSVVGTMMEKPKKEERAEFVKFDELDKVGVHQFPKKFNITNNKTIFEKDVKDSAVTLYIDTISFISFEYDMKKDIKNVLMKNYKSIKDIKIENGTMYAVVDGIIKTNTLPLGTISNAKRTMEEYLSLDNIPEEIRLFTYGKKDPIRLRDGKVYVELNDRLVVSKCIIDSKINGDNLNLNKCAELTRIEYFKNKVHFALRFSSGEGKIYTSTENIVAINFSMSHSRFVELTEMALEGLREGVKVRFVRTSDIINKKTRELVFAKQSQTMIRNPIIELTELSAERVEKIKAKGGTVESMFKQSKIPAYYGTFGITEQLDPNDSLVKKIYGELFTGEPVYYREENQKVFLCPNIKQLALFSIFETTKVPFNVGVKTDGTDIGIAVEKNR